ncbi:hypothetical protein ABL78_2961 [Leptomonas seymouri]|uniref:Uncharacterized protein n=1 Tax=Leptomonas seymouri TaxID=5684 RepID=A0A0N1PE12_LEPSE|nr:hypothetical protein ABL78_2961 [Leptomonas seymouri]|eukprot:KPI87970.1 hypothetical protein ABL78_2961 [Leptomonas seymouri]
MKKNEKGKIAQPNLDGAASPTHADTPSRSQQRDIDVDPHSAAPLFSTDPNGSTSTQPSPAPPAQEVEDLEHQSKEFLLQRVRALEQQLTTRNRDCARLLADRQQLLPLQEKCESQKEMILALRGQLDVAHAQRDSAIEAMEAMARRQRDQEHRARIDNAERAMYGQPQHAAASSPPKPATSSSASSKQTTSFPNIGRRNPGGTVVNTTAGPQLLYDSSDISSVGFTKNARLPYDFLGGPGAQQQYLSRYSGSGEVPDGGHDESKDAQVSRVINAAKDQVQIEAKHAEMEDEEEAALMARLKALREGFK